MIKVRKLAKDCLKAFVIGMTAAAATALVLFAGGALFGKNGMGSGLETMKNGLLLIFAMGLFLLSGMLMTKGKKQEHFRKDNGWTDHFEVIGPQIVLCLICVDFLIWAAAADYLLMIL